MILDKVRKKKIEYVVAFLVVILLISGCANSMETANTKDSALAESAEEEKAEEGEESTEKGIEKDVESQLADAVTKEEQGDFGEKESENEQERPKVKGIFVTGPMAGTDNMEHLITLVDETELNAIVIDVKNDEGRVTYKMEVPSVEEVGSGIRYIQDMDSLIKKCKEKDIYLIARIVAFKDPFMEQAKPEWCIHNKDGSIFKDKDGMSWLDPHNLQAWEYLLDIAEGALEAGFDEIQFDYMRFSTDPGMENVNFDQTEDRREVITEFVRYAAEQIHQLDGKISADVYGVVIDSEWDQKIVGQDYVELSKYLDYISPMVYPSHYGPNNYKIPVPDAEPYRLVLTAMQASRKGVAMEDENPELEPFNDTVVGTVSGNSQIEDLDESEEEEGYSMEELATLEPMDGVKAQVRPWLQDFTATWVKGHITYGAEEIRAQIQGVYDAGYEEWILWNASNRYTEEGLIRNE